MYIRTECGLIRNVDEIEISGAYYKPVTGFEYGIVKRGDNLIDVLELPDKFELMALIEGTTYLCTLVEIIKSKNLIRFLMQDGTFYSLATISMSDKNYNIISITTHEQYMKLAQEIK